MAGTATFNVGEVRRLYEHSKAAAEHSPSVEHQFDPQYHKGGVVLCKGGIPYKENSKEFMWPDHNNIDTKLVPACLDLVGDHGIYLMSNGMPALLIEEGKPNRVVAYAKESNPNTPSKSEDWYDAKVRIFGGDDGSVSMPIKMFEGLMALPDNATFKVKITSRNVQVIPPKLDKVIKLTEGMKVEFSEEIKFKSGFTGTLFKLLNVKTGEVVALDEHGKDVRRCKIDISGLRSSILTGTAKVVQ